MGKRNKEERPNKAKQIILEKFQKQINTFSPSKPLQNQPHSILYLQYVAASGLLREI